MAWTRMAWVEERGWSKALGLALLGAALGAAFSQATDPPTVEGMAAEDVAVEDVAVEDAVEKDPPQGGDVDSANRAVDAAPASAAEVTPQEREERRQRQLERNLDSVQRNIWWNRPRVIGNLELSESQRRSMDRLLKDYLRGTLLSEPNSKAAVAFRDALTDDDLAAARQHLEALGEEARQRGMAEGEMMLQVLGELTSTQLEILRQRHGPLLQRSWVKLVSNNRGRAGQGRRGAPTQAGPGGGPGSGPGGPGGGG